MISQDYVQNNMIVGACIVLYVICDRAPTKDCASIYHVLSLSIEKYNDYSLSLSRARAHACVIYTHNGLDDVRDVSNTRVLFFTDYVYDLIIT